MTKFGDRLLRALDRAIMPSADETRLNSLRVKLDSLTSTGFSEKLLDAAVEKHRQRISKMPQTGNAGAKREKLLAKLNSEGVATAEQIRACESALADLALDRPTVTTSTTTTATPGRSLTQVTNQALAMSGADVPRPGGTATSTSRPAAPPTPCLSQYQALLSSSPRKAAEYHLEHRTQIFEEISAAENARLAAARRKG